MNIEFTFEGLLLAGVTGLIITFAVDLWSFLKRMRNADLKKVPDPRARKSGMVKTHSQNVRKGTHNRHGEDFYRSGLHPYHQDHYSALAFDTRDSAVCGGRGSTEGSYGGSTTVVVLVPVTPAQTQEMTNGQEEITSQRTTGENQVYRTSRWAS